MRALKKWLGETRRAERATAKARHEQAKLETRRAGDELPFRPALSGYRFSPWAVTDH